MRPSALAPLFLGLAAALTACASAPDPEGGYQARTEKLAADCEARGGILAPTGGQSGRPENDNVCKITGGASRLTGH
jgi:predicted Rossmann-fold nucleotide-binding protein